MRTKNGGRKGETSLYMMDDHNHERMTVSTVGLDDGMRKKVEVWYKSGYSAAMAALRMNVFDSTTRKKIANNSKTYRHKILDLKGEIETEVGSIETVKDYFPEN